MSLETFCHCYKKHRNSSNYYQLALLLLLIIAAVAVRTTNSSSPIAGSASLASTAKPAVDHRCKLNLDRGPCSRAESKFYYNFRRGQCIEFFYSGCRGNENRFDTKDECMTVCMPSSITNKTTTTVPSTTETTEATTDPIAEPTEDAQNVTATTLPNNTTQSLETETEVNELDEIGCVAPSSDYQLAQKKFWMRSSFFHIFSQMKVPCNGIATKWQVISRVDQLDGLFLTVWRQQPETMKPIYALVGVTQVSKLNVTPDVWIDVPIREPFVVNAGDVLGFFYRSWLYTDSTSSIPIMPGSNKLDPITGLLTDETYVAKLQENDILFNATAANNKYTLDMTSWAKVSRRPALALFVEPINGTERDFKLLTTTPGTTLATHRPQDCLDIFRMAGACKYDIHAFKIRWYFDQPSARCVMFWYYPECVNSSNIFLTKEQCEGSCGDYLNISDDDSLYTDR